jgi:hypothetical protein
MVVTMTQDTSTQVSECMEIWGPIRQLDCTWSIWIPGKDKAGNVGVLLHQGIVHSQPVYTRVYILYNPRTVI